MSKVAKQQNSSGMDTQTVNVSVPKALAMILNKPEKPKEYPSRASKYALRLRGVAVKNPRGTTKPRKDS
jgi:hypothetical protein